MLDSRRAIIYIINSLHPLVAVKFVFLLDGPPQIRPFLHFLLFPLDLITHTAYIINYTA